jgi:hypothetical protein
MKLSWALRVAEKLISIEGDGLQAVHNCFEMNSALAAEGSPSPQNQTFPAACLEAPEVRFFMSTCTNLTLKTVPQRLKAASCEGNYGTSEAVPLIRRIARLKS